MSFSASTRVRSAPVLPLAGMVDVLFLLLIFFMTASVFRDQETAIDVSLPAAASATPPSAPAAQVVVTIDAEDQIFLGERPVTMDELQGILLELAEVAPDNTLVVRGDRDSRFGTAVGVMDLGTQAGLESLYVSTVRPAEGE